MKRLQVFYQPNGVSVLEVMGAYTPEYPNRIFDATLADGQIEQYITNILTDMRDDEHIVICTSQEIVINYIRLAIYNNEIDHRCVEFMDNYRGQKRIMFSDSRGRIDHWPDGFCDYNDRILQSLLEDFLTNEDIQ